MKYELDKLLKEVREEQADIMRWKNKTRGPQALTVTWVSETLYTEFLSEGCIFGYQQPHYYNKNKNQQLYRKVASLSFTTIAIYVKYIVREKENTYSL